MAVALLVAVAPVAHADTGDFLNGVHALGFQRSDGYLINTAQALCIRFTVGNTVDMATDSIVHQFGVGPGPAHQFVVLAVNNFCPQFNDRL
jgi:hypothetical protein